MSEGLRGWGVACPDRIRWWRNDSLVEELERLHDDWIAVGRPTLHDYRVEFVPPEDATKPPPTS
jgi:hypothetical protein